MFVIAKRVAGGIGVMAAEIVHRVLVGVLAGFLVLEKRVEEEFQQRRVAVEENRMVGEDDIDSLDVPIGTDFLEEEVCLGRGSNELSRTESLASCKGSDRQVVLTSSSDGVGPELGVEV